MSLVPRLIGYKGPGFLSLCYQIVVGMKQFVGVRRKVRVTFDSKTLCASTDDFPGLIPSVQSESNQIFL